MAADYLTRFSTEGSDTNDTALAWAKISFIIIGFFEAFLAGNAPTWSERCRKSPKFLGIANSFAGGVFLAIACMHILPENIESWAKITGRPDSFPLPNLLIFGGYIIILLLDKVLFDSSALFRQDQDSKIGHTHDPAEAKLAQSVKSSMARAEAFAQGGDPHACLAEQKEGTEEALKGYLNPQERFVTRLNASINKENQDEAEAETQ